MEELTAIDETMDSSKDNVCCNIKPTTMSDKMSLECIAQEISQNLQEPNIELIYDILSVLGVDKTLMFYEKTKIIEKQGGLYFKDGSCRKKPGGVFFYLIRHDSSISEGTKRIFSDSARKQYKLQKIKVKEKRIKRNEALKEFLIREGLLIMSDGHLKEN